MDNKFELTAEQIQRIDKHHAEVGELIVRLKAFPIEQLAVHGKEFLQAYQETSLEISNYIRANVFIHSPTPALVAAVFCVFAEEALKLYCDHSKSLRTRLAGPLN